MKNLDTSRLEDWGQLFCACNADSIDLSKSNTSSIMTAFCLFSYCKAEIIGIENMDVSRVSQFNFAFKGYTGHKNKRLDLSKWDMRWAGDLSEMFFASVIEELDLSGKFGETTGLIINAYAMFGDAFIDKLIISVDENNNPINDWPTSDLYFGTDIVRKKIAVG